MLGAAHCEPRTFCGTFRFVNETSKMLQTTADESVLGLANAIFNFEQQADDTPAGTCYAVTSPGFNPSYDEEATSGVVEWPCRDDDDCSLNGKCDVTAGVCACRPAWKVRWTRDWGQVGSAWASSLARSLAQLDATQLPRPRGGSCVLWQQRSRRVNRSRARPLLPPAITH